MEVIEDNSANDPPKELAEEKQEDKDVDQKVETPDKKDDETELSKELIEEKQEDKDVDKKEDLEFGMSEKLPSEDKESTTLEKDINDEGIKKEDENMENSEKAVGDTNEQTTKLRMGPASKIGRPPYRPPRKKIGPASRLGRRQIGPKFLRTIPIMAIPKLPNSTRKCNFWFRKRCSIRL